MPGANSEYVSQNERSSGLSLAIRLRDGSMTAWTELVDLYGPLVDAWCLRYGLEEAARADIGQEIFLAVYKNIGNFDPHREGATFRGWLWRITNNKILERLRRDHGPSARGGSTGVASMNQIADPFIDSESEFTINDASSTAGLVRRALDQIRDSFEENTWEAFWRTAALGRTATQVAEEIGLSAASVRQAKSRVLRRLRQQLGDG